jgi:hypothetical protein
MSYLLHTLTADTAHGDFTVGKSYPCLKQTDYGTTKARGFYWDNTGAVRMLPQSLFTPTDALWQPPAVGKLLNSEHRKLLAARWNVSAITVSNWESHDSGFYQPIRFLDALAGSKHELCREPMNGAELIAFIQGRGYYIQEVSVRWDMQQYGDRLKRIAQRQPGLFWDLWRGMMDNTAGATV